MQCISAQMKPGGTRYIDGLLINLTESAQQRRASSNPSRLPSAIGINTGGTLGQMIVSCVSLDRSFEAHSVSQVLPQLTLVAIS